MQLSATVSTFLRAQRVGRLATVGPDGRPEVVTLAYQMHGDTVLIGGPGLRSAAAWGHLRGGGAAAFLVEDRHGALPDVGVLLRGDAESDEERAVPVVVLRARQCRAWGLPEATQR